MSLMLFRWAIFVLAFGIVACAQDRDAIVHYSFDKGPAGWKAVGPGVVTTPQDSPGKFALAIEYDLDKPGNAALGLETSMLGFRRVHFQVKSDHDATLMALLVEKQPGLGKYTWFSVRAGKWETVDLNLEDFLPGENPRNPTAASVPFDLERVQGLAFSDASSDPKVANLFSIVSGAGQNPEKPRGKRSFAIRDLELVTNMSAPARKQDTFRDNFDRGLLQWLIAGAFTAEILSTTPVGKVGVKVSPIGPGYTTGMLYRRVTNFDLKGVTGFALDAAADVNTILIIALELENPTGPNTTLLSQPVAVTGNSEARHFDVPLSQFVRGQATTPLDPTTIRGLAIALVWAGPNQAEQGCWIGGVRAVR